MSRRDLFRNPGLMGILAREVISLTGSQMTWVALPWFVLTTSGSATRMTIVLAVEAAAVALGGFAGGLATRLGARRTMLICDGVRAPLMAAIPLLHMADALSFPLLLVLVAGVGVFATPSFASKTSLLPDLVGEDESRLGEANALLQTANRLAALLGPPIAGILIGVFGATEVLLIDAATFAVGFLITATLIHAKGIAPEPDAPKENAFRAVYRFLSEDPLLRPWSVVLILGDVMWLALFAALPVLVLERFGDEPEVVGLTFAGFGLGAVVGGAIAFRLVGSVDRILLASLGEIGMALPLWLLLVHASPVLLVVAFAVAGFANGLVNPALHTILQLRTPRALRTKVYSVVITATSILGPGGARRHGAGARTVRRRPDGCRARRDRHGARAAVLRGRAPVPGVQRLAPLKASRASRSRGVRRPAQMELLQASGHRSSRAPVGGGGRAVHLRGSVPYTRLRRRREHVSRATRQSLDPRVVAPEWVREPLDRVAELPLEPSARTFTSSAIASARVQASSGRGGALVCDVRSRSRSAPTACSIGHVRKLGSPAEIRHEMTYAVARKPWRLSTGDALKKMSR